MSDYSKPLDAAHQISEAFQEAAGSAVNGATKKVRRSAAAANDAADRLSGKANDYLEAVANQINDNPVRAILIALGVGFVIGRLRSRRA